MEIDYGWMPGDSDAGGFCSNGWMPVESETGGLCSMEFRARIEMRQDWGL